LNSQLTTASEPSATFPEQRSLPEVWVSPSRLMSGLVLIAVMIISAAFVGSHLLTGWVPADDGFLAQGAMRILQGQLPFRDFNEIYTGGLNYIHAAAFLLFGVKLVSLRIAVFLFFLAWVPAVYFICRDFVSPITAGAVTLLAVAWSFPNYPAAMPSWYNLFIATFGALALMTYLKRRFSRWLFIAGVCGGISVLVKVIGLYYIAGVLLFLVFVEQTQEGSAEEQQKSCWLYRLFSVGSLLVFLAVLLSMLRSRLGSSEIYHFILPSALVVGAILAGETRSCLLGSAERFARLFRTLVPFGLGVLTPITIFLIPFVASGSVSMLAKGLISRTSSQVAGLAVLRPLPVGNAVYALAVVAIVVAAMYCEKLRVRAVGLGIGLGLAVLITASYQGWYLDREMWSSIATITPLVAALGAILVAGNNFSGLSREERQRVMLLVALTATCSLVQYPFSAPNYFLYVAPLVLLAIVAIVASRKDPPGRYALAALLVFYLWFGVFRLVPSYFCDVTHTCGGTTEVLQIPRGGIRIDSADTYRDIVQFLKERSPNGLMYAGANCPQLYFLTGLKNPLRDDGGVPPEELLKAVQHYDLKLVVVNEAPFFQTGRTGPGLRTELARRFPHVARKGRFTIFWRD
jgi:hypothetical protein